jgi:hypothetical protein
MVGQKRHSADLIGPPQSNRSVRCPHKGVEGMRSKQKIAVLTSPSTDLQMTNVTRISCTLIKIYTEVTGSTIISLLEISKVKGKAIPVTDCGGSYGCEMLRFPLPAGRFLVLISVRG